MGEKVMVWHVLYRKGERPELLGEVMKRCGENVRRTLGGQWEEANVELTLAEESILREMGYEVLTPSEMRLEISSGELVEPDVWESGERGE